MAEMDNIFDIKSPFLDIPKFQCYNKWTVLDSTFECCNFQFSEFFNNFMIKNLPCVIKNVISNWECAKKWVDNNKINYDYIIDTYGDLEAPVADCHDIQYNAHCKSNMKVSEYMSYLRDSPHNKLLYLKDWHLKQSRPDDIFYEVPYYFGLDWLNEFAIDNCDDDFMFVYIGPIGSWTPLHEDVYCSYSWSVNVVGRKKWILFPPGEENKLKDPLGHLPLLFNYDLNKNVTYFEIIQEKGDALFVPSGWHHQVMNEMETISVNHNWINACNIDIVWKALIKSLLSVEHQIEEFKDTPEFPMQCQLILKSVFGMDCESFIKLICSIAKKRLSQLNGEPQIVFGKYSMGTNLVKFDLKSILNVMDLIFEHPVFHNVEMLLPLKDEFLSIKTDIAATLGSFDK